MTMNQFSKPLMLLLISTIIFTGEIKAQSLRINPKTSTMTIFGTTNVHDFKTKVEQMKGELVMNSSKKVQSLNIEVPVRSIKSGEKLMDKKTYEAFNDSKNPTISFQLIDVASLQITGEDINVIVNGNLTMAGVTKKISFKTTGKISKPGVYEFKGSIALKMTDFKMKPPTAMLGVMKVGDAITLKYDINLEGAPIN
jgi:polyisoprenoid-binding protein YceI